MIGRVAVVSLCAALAVMLWLTLSSSHLSAGPGSLVVSAVTAVVATVLIAFQPVLALLARSRRGAWRGHGVVGLAALVLALGHIAALWVLSPQDVTFAVSPDGPTRARMAVLATLALVVVVILGAVRRFSSVAPHAVRILHAFFAALALLLGVGHAVLTDGPWTGRERWRCCCWARSVSPGSPPRGSSLRPAANRRGAEGGAAGTQNLRVVRPDDHLAQGLGR